MIELDENNPVEIVAREDNYSRGIMERPLTATDIEAQVNLIQEVMQKVMKKGIHYGRIPGTPKDTLLKPGSEKLFVVFKIASTVQVEDLSTPDIYRYRITASGTHAPSGMYLGDAMGECSSDEEKYKWRKAVNREEWEDYTVDRRRTKYKKGRDNKIYTVEQVRTEPADIANTVLKMAVKRAEVALTLKVTACSDIFSQDLEEYTPEMMESLGINEFDMPVKKPRKKREMKPKATATMPPPEKKAAPAPAEPPPPPPGDPEEPPSEEFNGDDEPPWEDEEPEEDDDNVVTVQIESAEIVKKGTAASGREWVLYRVHAAGDRYTTFSHDLFEKAVNLAKSQALCKLTYEMHEKGLNLVGLEEIG